ncbi:MAG: hypothetical protein U5K31_15280 [Balneolaceae bacterium]|nr:hypothetical protein [Balneolaceae bacterium]
MRPLLYPCLLFGLMAAALPVYGQESAQASASLQEIWIHHGKGDVMQFILEGGRAARPAASAGIASFIYGGDTLHTGDMNFRYVDRSLRYILPGRLELIYRPDPAYDPGWRGSLTFRNLSDDTLSLKNVVPFGADMGRVYITGQGDSGNSSSYLFRPGRRAVNLSVPDNVRELGYAEVRLQGGGAVAGLTRRSSREGDSQELRRFEILLMPGDTITYDFWADHFMGEWREGFRTLMLEHSGYVPADSANIQIIPDGYIP